MSGYLYCLYNEVYKYYGEDVYKLGREININQCLNKYKTSYIKPSIIEISLKVKDIKGAEKILFRELRKYKVKNNREFYKVELKVIKEVFNFIEKLSDDEFKKEINEIKNISNLY